MVAKALRPVESPIHQTLLSLYISRISPASKYRHGCGGIHVSPIQAPIISRGDDDEEEEVDGLLLAVGDDAFAPKE
jgi:hypothetical protein